MTRIPIGIINYKIILYPSARIMYRALPGRQRRRLRALFGDMRTTGPRVNGFIKLRDYTDAELYVILEVEGTGLDMTYVVPIGRTMDGTDWGKYYRVPENQWMIAISDIS